MTDLYKKKKVELFEMEKKVRKSNQIQMKRTWNLVKPMLEVTRIEVLKVFMKFKKLKSIKFNCNGTVQMEFMVDNYGKRRKKKTDN